MKNHLLMIAFFLVSLFYFTTTSWSATIYMNYDSGNDTTGDGNSGNPYKTFHKGYTVASDGDTLDLTGTFDWTNADETGDVSTGYEIAKNVTIRGQNPSVTFIQAAPSAGSADRRVLNITASGAIIIEKITIRYANYSGSQGGGILNSANLTIRNANISYNRLYSSLSNQIYGGGIYNSGTLAIENSLIDHNSNTLDKSLGSTITVSGGGIYNHYSGATLTLKNSTIANNTGSCTNTGSSALVQGGGLYSHGTVNITDSTITQNTAEAVSTSGNPYPYGAGVFLSGGTLSVKNTVIVKNTANATAYDFFSNQYQGTLTDNGYNCVEYQNLNTQTLNAFDADTTILYNTRYEDPTLSDTDWSKGSSNLTSQTLNLASSQSYAGGYTELFEVTGVGFLSTSEGEGSTTETTDQRGYYRKSGAVYYGATPTSTTNYITRGAYQYYGVVARKGGDWSSGGDYYTNIEGAAKRESSGTIVLAGTAIHEAGIALDDSETLTIQGAGSSSTYVQADDTPDTASDRVFNITAGTVTLEDMTVRYGKVTGNPAKGGCIYSTGSLTLTDMNVTQCHAIGDDSIASANGGHAKGGGIYSNGTAALTNSTVSSNITTGGNLVLNFGTAGSAYGGGVYNEAGQTLNITGGNVENNTADAGDELFDFDTGGNAYGGGVHNNGTMVVNEASFSGNEALGGFTLINTSDGGHAYGGGIFNDNGDFLKVTKTVINNNTAQGGDAVINGGSAQGGGVCQSGSGTLTFENVTISGNKALDGTPGASGHGGGVDAGAGSATIINATISANTASDNGGGILNDNVVYLANTISINNTAGTGSDIYTNSGDTTYAYYSWYNGSGGSGTLSIQATAPCETSVYTSGDLGTLANNGGSTLTMAVDNGAPAYQAGSFIYSNDKDGYYIYDNQTTPSAHKVNDWNTPPSSPQASDKITIDQRGSSRGDPATIGAYDDGPTLVELASFTAQGSDDHVLLTWETASEFDNAGFHLWRSESRDGSYTRITQTLIPAEGSVTSGASYTWKDTEIAPPQVWFYKLEDVSTSGSRGFEGPVWAAVGDAAVKEVDGSAAIDETDTAGGLGSLTLTGTGKHTVATGRYGDNPAGTPAFNPTGDYWFVDVTDRSGLSRVVIRFCPAQPGDTVYGWDGAKWIPCSRQNHENGCIEVTVTDDTSPRISDLDRRMFSLGRANASIPTVNEWGMILLCMVLGMAGVFVMRRSNS